MRSLLTNSTDGETNTKIQDIATISISYQQIREAMEPVIKTIWIDGESLSAEEVGENKYELLENPVMNCRINYGTVIWAMENEEGKLIFERIVRASKYKTRSFLLSGSLSGDELRDKIGKPIEEAGGSWEVVMGGIAFVHLLKEGDFDLDKLFADLKYFPTEIVDENELPMTPSQLIQAYRKEPKRKTAVSLNRSFAYRAVIDSDLRKGDANLPFRTELVNLLLPDFSLADIHLIRVLTEEEIRCELDCWLHDNLYQLCYYLFELGQLEDCFILYDAKFGIRHMDACTMLDRTMITVGHPVAEVIDYVNSEFSSSPQLAEKYPGLSEELEGLIEVPDYDSIDDYKIFIRGYFGRTDLNPEPHGLSLPMQHEVPSVVRSKPWWKWW